MTEKKFTTQEDVEEFFKTYSAFVDRAFEVGRQYARTQGYEMPSSATFEGWGKTDIVFLWWVDDGLRNYLHVPISCLWEIVDVY